MRLQSKFLPVMEAVDVLVLGEKNLYLKEALTVEMEETGVVYFLKQKQN
jgi:hypothetical protein